VQAFEHAFSLVVTRSEGGVRIATEVAGRTVREVEWDGTGLVEMVLRG
jgi:hypothetical protein